MNRITKILTTVLIVAGLGLSAFASPEAKRIYLSGLGPEDAIEWDFFCSSGRKSGEWTTIPVPSNWEQEGFGGYNYGHDDPATKFDETGTYRTQFFVPEEWEKEHVRLVFEGAMTETSIKINDTSVGTANLGGYTPFRFILDEKNLKFGEENTLEVLVKKKPENNSLDWAERKADYWVFGGIYRPVYLEVQPKEFVNRVAIDARADGSFKMDVFPQIHRLRTYREELLWPVDQVTAQVKTLDGETVGKKVSADIIGGSGRVRLETQIDGVELWSPENPNRYSVEVELLREGKLISRKTEKFGFRTFEHRLNNGFYLNGKKTIIRGINRNMFDPKHGRVISKEKAWKDARAIKAMNVNLVRSHMPATTEFMEACDALGLMVITELTNWHDPYTDTPIARNIAYELVMKYQNHPSVVLWANGNENGFNFEIDDLYHLYDLQDRSVLHPWAFFEGIDTFHYPKYNELMDRLNAPHTYLPTEFLHGLYDGGHGAGLDDYWSAILAAPNGAGGVLWCWADAALERTDLDGKMDTYGNRSADGLVGPHGEKEASYFTVREIWSPVQIPVEKLSAKFDGVLPVENGYVETDLSDCDFHWKLLDFSTPFSSNTTTRVLAKGKMKGPLLAPGESGEIALPLPSDWRSADALELAVNDKNGVEVMKWSWELEGADQHTAKSGISVTRLGGKAFDFEIGNSIWSFSPETGQLIGCKVDGVDVGLGRGPVLYSKSESGIIENTGNWVAELQTKSDSIVINSKNESSGASFRWTLSSSGQVSLDYDFASIDEALVYCAVGFDLDEDQVAGKRWLGQGPHRVWANRLKGPQFGLWEDSYNDFLSGEDWGKPEFKGVFGDVNWMQVDMKSGVSLLLDMDTDSSVGVLNPRNTEGLRDKNSQFGPVRSWWHYPEEGGLFMFHKVPGIGTKFCNAKDNGPQAGPEKLAGPIKGSLTFELK